MITANEKPPKNMGFTPRLMRVDAAAFYLAMSTRSFLRLVESRDMPAPIKIRGMALWDRTELDDALENLKEKRRRENINPAYVLMGISKDDSLDDDDENENGND